MYADNMDVLIGVIDHDIDIPDNVTVGIDQLTITGLELPFGIT